MALVTSDTEKLEVDAPVVATTSYGYSRLRRPGYDELKLAAWAERLSTPEWEDCFVFFKHEDEGTGPRLAAEFEGLVTPIDDA